MGKLMTLFFHSIASLVMAECACASLILPLGGARRNAAPLNLKISACILCVTSADIVSIRGQIVRLFESFTRFYGVLNYMVCSRLEAANDVIAGVIVGEIRLNANLVILGQTVLGICDPLTL